MASPSSANGIARLHDALVETLKSMGCIQSPSVEGAFRAVPRHLFLPEVSLERVYSDEAILTKRTDGKAVSSSSQPAMMAKMLEQLDLQPGHRVLEIGAGTGYNAGLMGHLVGDSGLVVTIDIDEDLVQGAREHLGAAGLDRVSAVCRDGGLGDPDRAPYDRIILTVGAWDIVPAWWEQLKPGGRLLLPLVVRGGVKKSIAFDNAGSHLESVSVEDCGFIDLRGAFAKPQDSTPLGPESGLTISVDDGIYVDGEAAYGLLSRPSTDRSTGVTASPGEVMFGGLALWLSLREPSLCILSADGQIADRGLVPCFMENSGEWRRCWTTGLLGDESLSVFTSSDNDDKLHVRSYGRGTEFSDRLVEQVSAWDAAGRPSSDGLRVRAYPEDTDYVPSTGEFVVNKRWTQLVLDRE